MGYVRKEDLLNTIPKEYHRMRVKYGTGLSNPYQSGGALYLPVRKDYGNGEGLGETISSVAKFISDNKDVISAVQSAASTASTALDIVKKVKELKKSAVTNDDAQAIVKKKNGKGFFVVENK